MRSRSSLLVALVVVVVVGVAAVVFVVRRGDDSDRRAPFPPVAAADGVSEGVAPGDAEIVVIGDSVTHLSAGRIVGALPDRAVSVIGLSAYRTDEILPTVEDALGDGRPAVAVVMAGYNDVWQGSTTRPPVEEIVDLMADVDCAVWVLIPTKGPWDRDRAEDFDGRVRETAEAAGVHVETGWRDAVDAGAGDDPDPALVDPDRVHPSPEGAQRIAEVMAGAVTRSCG